MKKADLYIRVSTDEQADKGYSQRNQEEVLRKYCEAKSIQIRKVIFEDHSAKTFKRPAWEQLMMDLTKRRGQIDLILFTKWDRFSRNASDAYQMISKLHKLGIEPYAIEQSLDLSIPEHKIILGTYLTIPEVENDRRALNVFHGMRRAKKEGRWMGTAPIGYTNKTNEQGKKYIEPKEPEASTIKWAFQQLADGHFAADQIRKEVNNQGLKCSRSNFWNAIRNPVYCGKIRVTSFKDEEDIIVQGQHEGIISEALFYEVQEILAGRKRKERPATQIRIDENMPLRGFLICPRCGRMLTGSASKGRYNYYYYYHCTASCGCRFKTENTNNLFVRELRKYVPTPGVDYLYTTTLKEAYYEKTSGRQSNQKSLLSQIEELNKRLKNARELVADEKIDPEDFRELKLDCANKITILEAKLSNSLQPEKGINGLVNQAVENLCKMNTVYEKGTIIQKRNIIGSIYPEKLTFDGFQYRTTRLNEAVSLIYTQDKHFNKIKNRKQDEISPASGWVVATGIEPVSKV